MKPLIVGQAPGPRTNPDYPLYPDSHTGARLVALTGLGAEGYLERLDRTNLLYRFPGRYERDDKFPVGKARVAAEAIRPLLSGRQVVLLGRNVAQAFGLGHLLWHSWALERGFSVAVVPHPSGRCRWYDQPDNLQAARRFWADLLQLESPASNVVAFFRNVG